MVGYHHMFLIVQYFKVYSNLNEVFSINPNLIWVVAIYPNVYANPNEPLLIYPDLFNGTQVRKLGFVTFNYPVSVTQIRLRLLEFAQMFFFNFGHGNWWQAEAWIALLAGVVEVPKEHYGNSLSGCGSTTQPFIWEADTSPLRRVKSDVILPR